MNSFRCSSLVFRVVAVLVIACFAFCCQTYASDPSVAAPSSGSVVDSPFLLEATSSSCQSQSTASMAYSLDSGTDTVFKGATSIDTNVTAPAGTHTLRVKAWGNSGAYCETDVAITIGDGAEVSSPVNGSTVPPSFLLQASAPQCGGQSTSSMAYSFDSQPDNLFKGATSIKQMISASTGDHILRVKAWGNSGAFCETALNINVSSQSVVVNTPTNNDTVSNTFLLQAQAPTCDGSSTTSMAYSFDDLADNLLHGQQSINQDVTDPNSGSGEVLHVKAWNGSGALCETNVAINVSSGASGITITTPSDPNVSMSFPLQAQSATCLNVPTSSMAYSFDSLTDHVFSGQTSIDTTATAPSTGAHVLRLKAWNNNGDLCEKDMDINVIDNGLVPGSTANAITHIEQMEPDYAGGYGPCPPNSAGPGVGGAQNSNYRNWLTEPDCGTQGSKTGNTSYGIAPPAIPPSNDSSVRQFTMNYDGTVDGTGVRWAIVLNDTSHNTPADDGFAHFQYDVWVYFDQTSFNNLYSLEMDLNQTVGNPVQNLYIFATQCNLSKGVWQLGDNWTLNVDQKCPSNQFQPGWHHVQIQFHRGPNPGDPITFDAYAIDGVVQNFTCNKGGACTASAGGPNWDPDTLLPNFQLDGKSGGTSLTGYVDQFTIYRW